MIINFYLLKNDLSYSDQIDTIKQHPVILEIHMKKFN